ncbi:MAG TPA: DUF427 domain-containing protein [Acidimicrobiales bacterium]|jgi:uncharacterized protein (DUF427 family)|nr:DUF427 domain-containing protein [Acidimicrobiales bacterium]
MDSPIRYPAALMPPDRVQPVPRRIRAFIGRRAVVDSVNAFYVWEWAGYPQFYIPRSDVERRALVPEDGRRPGPFGWAHLHGLRCGSELRSGAAHVVRQATDPRLEETVRFRWSAFDAWFEEDERVYVHPRNPYSRVDAVRSTRSVVIKLGGAVVAETTSPVLVFETGLPTRYYLNRTDIDFSRMVPTDTVTECPYKGRTGSYWSVRVGRVEHRDLAWSYDLPTAALAPIAGLVAFYNERTDIVLDGVQLPRPPAPKSRPPAF